MHLAEQLVADGFREGASVNGINTDFYGRAIEIADSDDAETEHDEGEAEGGHCSQRRDDDSHHGPGPSTTEGTKQKNQGSKGKRKDKKNKQPQKRTHEGEPGPDGKTRKAAIPPPLEVPNATELLEKAKAKPPVKVREHPRTEGEGDTQPDGPEQASDNGRPTKRPKKEYPDYKEWNARHEQILKDLPKEATPPNFNHGEHSYSVQVSLGPYNKIAKIEIHVRTRAYRIIHPIMPKGKATYSWKDGIHEAWETAKAAALEQYESVK